MNIAKHFLIYALSVLSFCQLAAAHEFRSPAASAHKLPPTTPRQLYARQDSRQVGKISEAEVAEVARRRTSLNLWGYGIGPYRMRNLGSDALVYALALTNHREVLETAEIRSRLGLSVAEDGSAETALLSLGASFLPLTGEVTPLLGAELGLGFADGRQVKTSMGFAAALLLGVRFFRTASSQLEIVGRYETITKSNERGRPASYGVQIALLI